MRASSILLAAALGLAGCGDQTPDHGGGVQDLSVPDNTPPPDMIKPPAKCSPTDTLGDSQACGAGSTCPMGQQAVLIGGACKCYTTCDTANQATCPCDRFCDPLTAVGDGGVASGACLPGNGAGERCFTNAGGVPFGNGICQQGLACVPVDAAKMFRYCLYLCFGSNSMCPQQTECDPLMDANGHTIANVCNPLHGANGMAVGAACTLGSDTCVLGALCDGTTCRAECDGPNAACAGGGTCTAVTDATRIIGYVCK